MSLFMNGEFWNIYKSWQTHYRNTDYWDDDTHGNKQSYSSGIDPVPVNENKRFYKFVLKEQNILNEFKLKKEKPFTP